MAAAAPRGTGKACEPGTPRTERRGDGEGQTRDKAGSEGHSHGEGWGGERRAGSGGLASPECAARPPGCHPWGPRVPRARGPARRASRASSPASGQLPVTHGPCGRASPVLGRAHEQSREVAAARGAGAALTASDGSERTASACRPQAGGAASCGHRRLWRARDPRPRQRPPRCGLRRAARRCWEVTRAACAQGHPAARSWVTGPAQACGAPAAPPY